MRSSVWLSGWWMGCGAIMMVHREWLEGAAFLTAGLVVFAYALGIRVVVRP